MEDDVYEVDCDVARTVWVGGDREGDLGGYSP